MRPSRGRVSINCTLNTERMESDALSNRTKRKSVGPATRRPQQAHLTLESIMEGELEVITRKAIEMAKGGHMAAIRLVVDRLAPAGKERPIDFELPALNSPADAVTASAAIAAAVSAGDLTPSGGDPVVERGASLCAGARTVRYREARGETRTRRPAPCQPERVISRRRGSRETAKTIVLYNGPRAPAKPAPARLTDWCLCGFRSHRRSFSTFATHC